MNIDDNDVFGNQRNPITGQPPQPSLLSTPPPQPQTPPQPEASLQPATPPQPQTPPQSQAPPQPPVLSRQDPA